MADALRLDETPADLIPSGFTLYPCTALNNSTEPSLTTILSGKRPDEHGVLRVGQPDSPHVLQKLDMIQRHFRGSFIASPAVIFYPHFTYSSSSFYATAAFLEAEKHIDKTSFMLIHVMDVHDYKDQGFAMKHYQGFEPIPENQLDTPTGLHRPCKSDLLRTKDAGFIKAKYRTAARRVFEEINRFIEKLEGWRTIITADHGEAFGENGWWFCHDGVNHPNVYKVPLIVNFSPPAPSDGESYTHLDLYRMVIVAAKPS